jgi:hypothetical protein
MKISKLLVLFLSLFCFAQIQAQAPQVINYQAVVRDAGGIVVANKAVSFRLSILTGTSTGSIQYSETHSAVTNAFGLVTLGIGLGSPTFNSMSAVTWATGSKFLRVEVDINGGVNFTVLGTTQFLSVPFALYAATSGNSAASGWGLTGNATTATNFIGTTNADDVRFNTEGSQKMVLKNSGYLGIGTPNPDARLVIEGTSTDDDRTFFKLKNNATNAASNVAQTLQCGTKGTFTLLGHSSSTYTVSENSDDIGQVWSSGKGLILRASPVAANLDYQGVIRFYTGWNPNSTFASHERMRVSANGNVGIGTQAPTNRLHIEGNEDGLGNSERVFLKLKNNSMSAASNVAQILQCGAKGTFTLLGHSSSTYTTSENSDDIGQMWSTGKGLILRASPAAADVDYQGVIRFYTGWNPNSTFASHERMRVSANGNVGIGTQAPTNKLNIEGNEDGFGSSERVFLKLKNNSTSAASNVGQMLQAGNKGTFTVMSHHSSTYSVSENSDDMGQVWSTGKGLILRASPASADQDFQGSIRFYTGWNTASTFGSTERMRVEANGNVGIGTTTPKAKLEITNGDVYVNDSTKGIILKAPNGSCWRVTVDNTGNFVRTAITCPN